MKTIVLAAVVAAALGTIAHADDDRRCGNIQIDKWMSEAQIRSHAENLGIDVREVDIDDGCYEVEGRNRDGRRVEVRMNPETGAQVSIDGDD